MRLERRVGAHVLLVTAAVAAAGCSSPSGRSQRSVGGDAGAADGSRVVGRQEALESAPWVDGPPWVVQGGGCTGTVLSERWILTAGHCVDRGLRVSDVTFVHADGTGTTETIYRGPVWEHPHPNYDRDDRDGVNEWDVGLFELTGPPIDLSKTGRAKLANGTMPWNQTNETSYIFGYGDGSFPSGSGCNPNGEYLQRRLISHLDRDGDMVETSVAPACRGDSGGPWTVFRSTPGGYEHLVFAVTSGNYRIFTKRTEGPIVNERFDWIYDEITQNNPFDVAVYRDHRDYEYREIHEWSPGWRHVGTAHGMCLQVADPARGQRSLIEIADCEAGLERQQFRPTPAGELRWQDGLCVDVQWGDSANGTPLWLWPCNGTDAQSFGFGEDMAFRSGLDFEKCVDVDGGRFTPGTQVQLWGCNGTIAQRMYLTDEPRRCPDPDPSHQDASFCRDPLCPCSYGEGDCDGDDECQSYLSCGANNGPSFGFPEGWDVCEY